MLTTNQLTKIASASFAAGVAAVASLAGSLFVVPSASAQTTCFEGSAVDLKNTNPTVLCGDKTFKNFALGGSLFNDGVVIEEEGGTWTFFYLFDPIVTAFPGSFSIGYEVDITDPYFLFDGIGLTTLAAPDPSVLVTKQIFDSNTNALIATLSNTEGFVVSSTNILPLGLQQIKILDTISVSGQGQLAILANRFSQQSVPEPGTILGLLAVGGLGIVSKFRKQK